MYRVEAETGPVEEVIAEASFPRRAYPRVWVKYLNIVRELAVADFRLKYHDSALGYVWSMLHPMVLFVVYHFVFSYLFVSQVYKFTYYLLSGIIFWNFFSDATLSSMGALQAKSALAKRIYFPRILIVFSSTATALISFAINTFLLWIVLVVFDHVSWRQILVLLPFISIVMLALGVSLILTVLYIHFRDIIQIWSVVLTVGFWLTPIVYDALAAPAPLRMVALIFNPVGRILVILRSFLVFDDYPSIYLLLTTPLSCLLVLLLGVWLFQRHEHKVTEYL